MPQLVAPFKTQLSRREAVELIRRQFEKLTGSGPSRETLAILASQSAIETGNWLSMYNWNFGNTTVLPSSSLPAFVQPGDEQPGETEHYYQAYNSPDDGALDWLSRIRRKWPNAWEGAVSGNFDMFHEGLLELPAYHTTGYDSVKRVWVDRMVYRERTRPVYAKYLEFIGGGEVQDTRPLARPVPPPLPSSWVPRLSGASLMRSADPEKIDVLRFGMRGADVAFVQFVVKAPLTGMYDSFCEQAVKDYQARRGLKVDGIWGPQCWKDLRG